MSDTDQDIPRLIERLHRRFLDVVRVELNRLGYRDLTPVQALLLTNIGDDELAVRELIDRGYYQGSNVSYNMKKLVEGGYLEQNRSEHDRRSIRIRLTEKSADICRHLKRLETESAAQLAKSGMAKKDIDTTLRTLRDLERLWSDMVRYGK